MSAGWDPTGPMSTRWTYEDNQAATLLGWMIAQPPGSDHLDLFSLKANKKPNELMADIVKMAPIHPLCARAVASLSAQRILYPDTNFAFVTR